ncbi:uncharacterized protein LOC129771933 isoform X2 [Toxorhynchites rutilus septentrionalis]|uniref:uncharacterized protein LOC129771933 isoform X2 n=1 Tax=Toxorhynchites rutilus septentrionalis TaxID=329112 RepID=UPI00247A5B6F|nr:uncharacterized protein LOC129771933 isoform X2 [Toxorhynchites rutilus septentrionalis]
MSGEDDKINITIKEIRQGMSDTNRMESLVERQTKTFDKSNNKMSGATRRRMKRFIQRGYDKQQAREMALEKPPSDVPAKRPSNAMDLSGSSDGKPEPKRIKDTCKARPYNAGIGKTFSLPTGSKSANQSDVTIRVKVGILPKNYPVVELSTDQQNLIEDAIFDAVLLQRKEQLKPKFANCTYKPGYMIINCLDKPTSEWLMKLVPSLVPWKDAELLAVDESNIPKPDILVTIFPKSVKYDNNIIKALIESQNNNINTDAWRILKRSVINNLHIEWALTVDGASMKTLVNRGMTINYKFGQISFRKSNRSSGKPKTKDPEVSDEGKNPNSGQTGSTCSDLEGKTKGVKCVSGIQNSGSNKISACLFQRESSSTSSRRPEITAGCSKSFNDTTTNVQKQTSTKTIGSHSNQRDNLMPLKNGNQQNPQNTE